MDRDGMRYRILGPLLVWDGSTWSHVRAAQQRLVLAILLTESGQAVSAERLVHEIWGGRPPRTALNTLQGYVARLRRLIGHGAAGPLLTRGRGYELVVRDGELDAARFGQLAGAGQRAASEQRPEAAVADLSEALALWRGAALADVPESAVVAAESARLEQARLGATECWVEALLALGRYAAALDELRRLVAAHPLRERLWAQLVLALYQTGQRGEALAAYQRARDALVGQLGIEPGAQLRELQQAILDGDPAPGRGQLAAGGTGPARVPAELPCVESGFTGREDQLAWLDARAAAADTAPPAPMVVSITGPAGVGKTALALYWAHRQRDLFPDGQLYVDLRGYGDEQPLPPSEVLGRFLRSLGAPERVPADVDQAAAAYRSSVAGRRMLVLLDNARDAAQVRPLLPGAAGCLVLVTGRTHLRGLTARPGAARLDLRVLTGDEASALLAGMLGAPRVAAEPEAVAELARLCGFLPLALRIAGANLGGRPAVGIARYAAELAAGGLTALAVDGDLAVRRAFDHSYAALPESPRRLFRLLGVVAGPDISVVAAAALAGLDVAEAGQILDQLADAHLLDERGAQRYAFHDLIRRYAVDRAAAEDSARDRLAAGHRLLEFYRRTMDTGAEPRRGSARVGEWLLARR